MSMETDEPPKLDNLIFGEIQVLLAEKRTALASLRTGIAVFALPLSVLSVLIATSRYYNFGKVMPLLAPLLLLNLGLVVLGSWLIYHSICRLHHYDRLIRKLTQKYQSIAEFIE
jgi:predicted membrane protein